jgi:UDP-N-acetylmuramoylalanine--D-glutamate ligase
MRVAELRDKNLVIWGTGKEGLASAELVHKHFPEKDFTFVDEGPGASTVNVNHKTFAVARSKEAIAGVVAEAEVVIKSPGVSLYHPLLEKEKARGCRITSLMNLWMADKPEACVIGVTGTKGKSTTATLLNHVLNDMGKKSAVLGNIGTPVTKCAAGVDFIVMEVSSYQAANFSEMCDVGVLTSLFPEHLDWHRSLEKYYRDKANLLAHSTTKIVEAAALKTLGEHGLRLENPLTFDVEEGFHVVGEGVYAGPRPVGRLTNAFLSRAHNHGNVCAVLQVVSALGLDAAAALKAMESYRGLPHRQYELGEKDGVLYVDDSISTTPQSAIAAMEVYRQRPLTLIAGGFDREIDYAPLVDYVAEKRINSVVCMGPSGKRIFDALKQRGANAYFCENMQETVAWAKKMTPTGGVLLLSPAAPSYGMFKNYIERAESFCAAAGFESVQG